MISVSGKKWAQKKNNKNLTEKLKQDYDFSEILSKLIISRNFDNDEINTIDNDLKLNNVFLKNDDFAKSIEIVKGDSIFCATGITTSDVLSGIEIIDNNFISQTLVTHKNSNYKEIVIRTNPIKE